jgi:hypothetical protein
VLPRPYRGGIWSSRTISAARLESRHSADGGGQERSHVDDETIPMKRLLQGLAAVFVLVLVSATTEYAAGGAPVSPTSAVITFDDAGQSVQLTIPTPACPVSQPQCEWKFFLNEPKLHVDVATVYGTSGILTIDYPSNFCGVIQADAYVGPPWVPKRGYQHTIEDCAAVTPTPTLPPSAGATSEPPTTTMTTTTTAASTPPPAPPDNPVAAATAVPAAAAPPATTPSTTPVGLSGSSKPAQLPFTGRDIKPFLLLGWSMVALGSCLLMQRRRRLHARRRYRHQARTT